MLTFIFLLFYYLKFYLIVLDPDLLMTVGSMGSLVGTFPPSIGTLFTVYTTMACGFISFCLTCGTFYLLLSDDSATPAAESESRADASRLLTTAALLAITLLVLRGCALYGFDYVLAANHDNMPSHFAAVNEFAINSAICLCGLLIVDYARNSWWQFVGVGLLFARAALDMALTTTKGGLAEMAILLGVLWLVKGATISRKQVVLLGICISFTVAIYPLMIGIRSLRLTGVDLSTAVEAAGDLKDEASSAVIFSKPAPEMIFGRLPGADALIALVDRGAEPLGTYSLDMWFGRRKSKDIVDYVSYDMFEFWVTLMPSMLGEFFVIGGDAGVTVGVIVFTFGVLLAWRWLLKQRFLITHALQALFATTVFGSVLEGGLDYQLSRAWPLMIVAAMLVEWMTRWSFQPQQQRTVGPQPIVVIASGMVTKQ
ncbi:MAG: hypothetical protein ACLQDV_16230 [Candidatus Binataceae bacterium]